MPAVKSDIGRYEDLVKHLLTEYKFLRDDIDDLYLACISTIMGKEYIRNTSLYQFFHKDKKDPNQVKLPSMASIIRLNTKLQKNYPELRGEKWEERQKHSKDYKEDLGYGR